MPAYLCVTFAENCADSACKYYHCNIVLQPNCFAMILYDQVFENNQRWVADKLRLQPEYFSELSSGQNPDILYIGCSDSRVTAEEMTGVEPGQMFVHRNIANLVPNNDLSSSSVARICRGPPEGQTHRGVRTLLLRRGQSCHAKCRSWYLNPWLRNIRDVYRLQRAN